VCTRYKRRKKIRRLEKKIEAKRRKKIRREEKRMKRKIQNIF
jgi:hypothetical protein